MKSLKATSQKKHKRRIILVATVLVIVIAAGAFAYDRYSPKAADQKSTQATTDAQATNSPPSDKEIDLGNQIKSNTVNKNANDGDHPAPSNTLDVSFTSVNQNGATVQIRTLITQVISGSCKLQITNGSKSKSYTVTTQAQADATTCTGFNIPASDLGAGTWSIKLTVTATDGKQGEASTTRGVV